MSTSAAAERLLNLLIALSNASHRMTREEIRSTVAGYEKHDPADPPQEAAKKTQAFERMFERDKDDLRQLGVPLRTVTDAVHGDDIGYTIDPSEAALAPVTLTSHERAVISIAARYWNDAELSHAAHTGGDKLGSIAERGSTEAPIAARASLDMGGTLIPLAQAISRRQAVTFRYPSSAGSYVERVVEPWRIVFRGAVAYLVGHDRERAEARTFRLSRIDATAGQSAVSAHGEPGSYSIPDVTTDISAVEKVFPVTARMALRPESGHTLRKRGRFVEHLDGADVFEVDFPDADTAVAEVMGHAGAATLLSPPSLVDVVRAHADAALEVCRGSES